MAPQIRGDASHPLLDLTALVHPGSVRRADGSYPFSKPRSLTAQLIHAMLILPARGAKVESEECAGCGEGMPCNECPEAERECGHHCNHSWTDDACCWCGKDEWPC